jgi:hypothetical protein
MKKITILVAVLGLVGLFSCKKDGVIKCTNNTAGIAYSYNVSEDDVEYCIATVCSSVGLGGATQDEFVEDLEAAGFTCK